MLYLPKGFNKDLTYYISGPMNGYPLNNIPAFEKAEELAIEAGVKVLSPHTVEHIENARWTDFLSRDIIEMLQACQGIILLHGWPQSKGAALELSTALALRWPVYYLDTPYAVIHDMNNQSIIAKEKQDG